MELRLNRAVDMKKGRRTLLRPLEMSITTTSG
jgi:hypothetical protein